MWSRTSRRSSVVALLAASAVALLAAPALPAQTRTIAERLGDRADAKLLILHADDLTVAHSVNAASLEFWHPCP